MKLFSREELRTLFEARDGHCVSIFLPTHRSGAETRQDPIRFSNLLKQAEEQLTAQGMNGAAAKRFMQPAQALASDEFFWQRSSDGLAVFLADGFFRYFRAPLPMPELALAAERFHLKPLLPLLTHDGRFYVLALSQNQVRLLQGTRFSISAVPLESVPPSLKAALEGEVIEKQFQHHTGGPAGRAGGKAAIVHGHGAGSDLEKDRLLRYFRQVDQGIHTLLKDERAPLVLAGVEYLFPIYREAGGYPYVAEQGITGNPETMSATELHQRAWAILEPHFRGARDEARAEFDRRAGTGLATSDLGEILVSASSGRILTLFVAVDGQQWGRFDPGSAKLELRSRPEPGDEDLLDLAAIQAMLHGGTAYALPHERVPGGNGRAAAVFRY